MLLSRRPDVERFLAKPGQGVRAALIYGRDLGVVRERGQGLAAQGHRASPTIRSTSP